MSSDLSLPSIPVPTKDFISHFAKNRDIPVSKILEPFKAYESELRKYYAQKPNDPVLQDGLTNMVPVFNGNENDLKVRARKLDVESEEEKGRYVMPLLDKERKPEGAPAVVTSLKEFQKNFSIFSESSLAELDWNNVVAAGSSVTTALLPVPKKWNGSKRALREYYHEKLAPASDVDLFLYGLSEEEGLEKIKQIESNIRDSILHEVTTIRTKNAITIVSQYPTRHVQIVLRLYDSISQIITGFDVDCSCAAYDGKQVWASPRALAAFATQINTIDLTRRSPSYENRLSKYSHRGFEVYWEALDRSRVDPTIFERSFDRTLGLARLLVLEKLPKAVHRERYADKRRQERGRPAINRDFRMNAMQSGNLKQQEEDEVAEWVEEDQISDYNTMVVPYGKKFTASKILRLLHSKDLLLNSEWNKPKDREVNLHRHPCFFGTAEEVLQDCCGYCPKPKTDEEKKIAENESKLYISGALEFIKDDPGRQEVGSFNPITTDDWTEMGYVGNTQMLCQAIVDGDLEYIRSWLEQEGNNPDTRDYVGRTPLHLAAMNGAMEVVKLLVEGGAKLIYRLLDGRSALHIASQLGHADIVKILMDKSLENEEQESEKADKKAHELRAVKAAEAKRNRREAAKTATSQHEDDIEMLDAVPESDFESLGDEDTDMNEEGSDDESETQGFTKLKNGDDKKPEVSNDIPDDNEDEPDFYNINAPSWDLQCTPLHLAIMGGHVPVIRMLVEDYGADVLNPIKLAKMDHNDTDNKAILPLVLGTFAPEDRVKDTTKTLLDLGTTTAQADMKHFTALHYIVESNKLDIIDLLFKHDGPAAKAALNVIPLVNTNHRACTALSLALAKRHERMATKLIGYGAKSSVAYDDWIESYFRAHEYARNNAHADNLKHFQITYPQPIISAASRELTTIVYEMVEKGADVNTLTINGQQRASGQNFNSKGHSLLDIVQWQIKKYEEFDCTKHSRYNLFNDMAKPETLKEESHYLQGLRPGTYQYWTAQNRFRSVKALNVQLWAHYNAQTKAADDQLEKKAAKMEKAAAKKIELGKLEAYLISKGAKTFKELHPLGQQPMEHNQNNRQSPYGFALEFEDYQTKFSFNRPTLSDNEKEGYTRLFEAVWANNIEDVKSLTLGHWAALDGTKMDPLHVAVMDWTQSRNKHYCRYSLKPLPKKEFNFTGMHPLAIAVLKGHRQMAKMVMEIALAQYEKPDSAKKPSMRAKKSQWRLEIVDRDNEDHSDDDGQEGGAVKFTSRLVDDTYTIDNIAALAKSTKSSVEPFELLRWRCNAPWFDPKYHEKTQKQIAETLSLINDKNGLIRTDEIQRSWSSVNECELTEHAIVTDDLPLLRFLWEICPEKHGECTQFLSHACLSSGSFDKAIRLGRTSIMAEMIRRLGPYVGNLLTTTSGVVKTEKIPKYYQGLNVGGKKNKAWVEEANPDRQLTSERDFGRESSLLLRAAKFGNLESVQWFLTELPLQEYIRYAEAYPHDQDIIDLEKAPGGYKKAIADWLGLRKELILHTYLVTKRDDTDDKPLLDYLLQQFSQLLEKRSIGGLTPLMIAIKHQSVHIIKKLLDAGANPRAKDGNGYNAMHYLFKRHNMDSASYIRPRISLFAPSDVKEMLLEPTRWGELVRHHPLREKGKFMLVHELIESFIGGQDLVLRHEGGDYPLHIAIKNTDPVLVKHLLALQPQVADWENASGITAYELAEGKQLSKIVKKFAKPVVHYHGDRDFDESYGIELDEPGLPGFRGLHPSDAEKPMEETVEIFEILKEVMGELKKNGEWKRRLVTLGEVNDVADRMQSGRSNCVRPFAQVEEEKEAKKEKWDETVGMAL